MIERISLLLEIVSFLIVLNHLYEKRFKLDIVTILFVSYDVILFQLVNDYGLGQWITISVYIAAVFYVYFCFDNKIGMAVAGVITAMVITGFIQVCVALISNKATNLIEDTDLALLVVNLLTLLSVILFTRKVKISEILKFIGHKGNQNKMLKRIIVSVFIMFILSLVLYKVNDGLIFSEYILLISFVIIIYLALLQWKNERQIALERERQLKIQSIYNQSFDMLLSEVRDRQHDFKNHLNALFGLHYTCNTYDELVKRQTEYSQQILENSKFNKLIYTCKNPVIAGFLYNKFLIVDKSDIKIEYSITLDSVSEDVVQIFDIIEILGILLDNAVEALKDYDISQRKIKITFMQQENMLVIRTGNICNNITSKEIGRFFKKGYSSKGSGRGLGLNKIQKLKEKYNGKIFVNQDMVDEENWILFEIHIPQ